MCEEFGSTGSSCTCTSSCTCSGDWISLVVCASLIQFDDINNYFWMLVYGSIIYKTLLKHVNKLSKSVNNL